MKWVLVLFLGVAISGCVDRSAAGEYTGKRDTAPGPEHIVGTLSKVRLELRADGTFSLMNTSLSFEGTWVSSGDRVSLKIKEALGRSVSYDPMPYLERTSEGWVLHDPGGVDPSPVLLKRVSL